VNTDLVSAKINALNAEKRVISKRGTQSWGISYSQQRMFAKAERVKGILKDGEHTGDVGFEIN